jgi:uncharacterized membrane protein
MRRPHVVVLSCATLLIAIGYSALAVWRHTHFLTNGHDLGIFDQGLWALSRLEAPATTVRHAPLPNLFGDHFHPILILLVPWYWVFDSPIVLLVAQALLFAAVVPVGFLLARQLGIPPWPSVVLSGSLGIHPGLTTAARFDFHEIAFAPVLLLTAVLLAERKAWRWYWLALAGFFITKESMALYAGLFGMTLMLRRQWKIGVTTLVISLGYFFVVTSLVMPALADRRYAYLHLYPELGGGSPRQVIEHIARHPIASVGLLFSTPEKRHTIGLMFGSFAYLPMLSWTMWPMLFMTLAERFWSIRAELWVFRYHYQAVMTAVLFVATLYVLQNAGRRFAHRRAVTPAIAMLILLTTAWTVTASGVWTDAFNGAPAATISRWRAALRRIPPDARVSAQGPFVPHLSHRPTLYQFPRVRDAEYVIVDPEAGPWPLTSAEVRAAQERLPSLGWHTAWRQDTTTIFRRAPDSRTPPSITYWE